jgi:hypothetical protein
VAHQSKPCNGESSIARHAWAGAEDLTKDRARRSCRAVSWDAVKYWGCCMCLYCSSVFCKDENGE